MTTAFFVLVLIDGLLFKTPRHFDTLAACETYISAQENKANLSCERMKVKR